MQDLNPKKNKQHYVYGQWAMGIRYTKNKYMLFCMPVLMSETNDIFDRSESETIQFPVAICQLYPLCELIIAPMVVCMCLGLILLHSIRFPK